ncbi:ABC transporter ATP-binding protein [uncultured Alsobacter sp.]|uniref:ABC transporter ATP-binding protein n=1 Tax=uncultured Alsobacter sp. TaxID=1748258 RepID=UPI0025F700F1|nr:sn-glycerol-3-phosphate ABC transporter ATP-binding protein UgpC [uncultured Alsobacter sp.]
MANVKVRNLKKVFGSVEVIPGISIDVTDGEFVALVGPSGCGKSTLLRMIAGLEAIDAGTIAIGERIVNDVAPKDRDIAMVFQNYALYPNKTVAANIGFPLYMAGMGRAERTEKVNAVMRALALEPLAARYPKQLSGGQRQRVAMGRAIVRNPQVFLFDEPLSNLDAKLRVKMRAEIKELHQRLKVTTIYVTHDQVEAMTMADRIVVMRAGHMEQAGRPLDLYDRPANRFVAGFIGSPSMNFVDGSVTVTGNGASFVSTNGLAIPLPAKDAERLSGAKTLGIRPEHIDMQNEEAEGFIPMSVVIVEPTGNEATFIVRSGADELVVALNGRHDHRPGDTVWLRPAAGKLHFFDAKGDTV